MAEGERAEAELVEVAAAEAGGAGSWLPAIQIHSRPATSAARRAASVGRERRAGGAVVEAVAEADDPGGRERGDLGREAVERLGRLVGRQQRPAAAGQALGLAEVEVGDAEQPLVRPPERAGGAGRRGRLRQG